jgi:tight adherence protein C
MSLEIGVAVLSGTAVLVAGLGIARRAGPNRAAAMALVPVGRSTGLGWQSALGQVGRWWIGRAPVGVGGPAIRPPASSNRRPDRGARIIRDLPRRMAVAGIDVPVETVVGLKLALAAGGLGGVLLLALSTPIGALLAPLGLVLGHRVPDIAIARRAGRRQSRMARQVVDLVELLSATTEAGLGPSEALRRSAAALSGPLGDELHAVVGRIELGEPWRSAFSDLVRRTEIPSLRRLSVALGRSQRLGTSLRTALRSVAQDLRDERRIRAEEAARRAPVKMLFPLVLLILPAFLLLTVGPVLLATIRSLDSG